MKQYKYIGNITRQELDEGIVQACINEDGFRCVLIKNAEPKTVLSRYETDNMEIKLNATLAFNDQNYYFHIITTKKNDYEANRNFDLVYEYIFMKIKEAVSDDMLAKLILSLEEYFRISPERDSRKLQIGVWGELFCVLTLYKLGYVGVIEKYHNNFFLKHDIEFSDSIRMEIKTTVGTKRIHHFRHDQICRADVVVLVASLLLEESQEGLSLYELANLVMNIMSEPDDIFALQKILRLCGISEENKGLIISKDKALEDIRYFLANQLPMLDSEIPQGISNVEYDVDCSFGEHIDLDMYISDLK